LVIQQVPGVKNLNHNHYRRVCQLKHGSNCVIHVHEAGETSKIFIACHLSKVHPRELSIASTQIKAMENPRVRKV